MRFVVEGVCAEICVLPRFNVVVGVVPTGCLLCPNVFPCPKDCLLGITDCEVKLSRFGSLTGICDTLRVSDLLVGAFSFN